MQVCLSASLAGDTGLLGKVTPIQLETRSALSVRSNQSCFLVIHTQQIKLHLKPVRDEFLKAPSCPVPQKCAVSPDTAAAGLAVCGWAGAARCPRVAPEGRSASLGLFPHLSSARAIWQQTV